jgi:pimeloyl-ACP methyl ester carboxylesterase
MDSLRWFFLKFLGTGAIAYCLICFVVLLGQNRLIFFPHSDLQKTPQDLGLNYQEIWLAVKHQDKINGWWIPSVKNTSDTILYLHGNGSNIGDNLERAEIFHRLGLNVFLIDYRGYGLSKGKFPTEKTVYDDAQTAYDYLKDKGIKPEDIFIYGQSLGGAIAINLAVNNPQIAGLIIESSFTSMRDMVAHQKIYNFLPVNLILTQRFDSLEKLPRLKTPILFIHGMEDRIVPARMSEILYRHANYPKQILLIPHADHNDVTFVGGQQYIDTIQDFYSQL